MTGETTVHLVAVGDIMLGRGVKAASVAEALDLLSPELVRCLSADIVTGNLECLIGSSGAPMPASHSHFQGDPEFSRSLLQLFDVVSVANNHIGDFGDEAVGETLDWLTAFGVRTVGIGQSVAEAVEPAVFDVREQKIAVFGATTVGNLASASRYNLAEPGPSLFRRARELAEAGHTCVLHLHAGGGDVCHPSPATRRLLDEATKEDFSVVLGHHPHVVQGYVTGARRAVFYSLGDFLFDKLEDGRDQALLVTTEIGGDGSLSDTDIRIVRRSPDLRLELLEGDELRAQKHVIRSLSDKIGNGQSDDAYRKWRGSRLKRLMMSLTRDYQAGGLLAIRMKLQRVNRRRLRDLFLGR